MARDSWAVWKVAPPANERGAREAFETRDALRRAMARQASRSSAASRRPSADMVARAWAEGREAARKARVAQAQRAAEQRRRAEEQEARRDWKQIRDARGYTDLMGMMTEPPAQTGEANTYRSMMDAVLGPVGQEGPEGPLGPFSQENLKRYEAEKNKPSKDYLAARNKASKQNYKNFKTLDELTSRKDIFPDDKKVNKAYDPRKSAEEQADNLKPEAIKKYEALLSQWYQEGRGMVDGPLPTTTAPGADGSLLGGLLGPVGGMDPQAAGDTGSFPYFLTRDEQGNWVIEDYRSTVMSYVDRIANPEEAGLLAFELVSAGYYGSGSAAEKRLAERLQTYQTKDGEVGYRLNWGEDDWDALKGALKDAQMQQMSRIGGIGSALSEGERAPSLDYRDIISEKALSGLGMAQDVPLEDGDINNIGQLKPGVYGGVELNADQLANADVIAAVGFEMGASNRDVMIALMTAMQESRLSNLNHGDRDSLGLFQQRPSQGWGTPEQVTNPRYAARKFFEGLLGINGRDQMAPTQAAQAVQKSAFPDAYAKHQPVAEAIMGIDNLGSGGSDGGPLTGMPDFSAGGLPSLNADGTAGSVSGPTGTAGGTYSTPGGQSSSNYPGGNVVEAGAQLSHPDTIRVVAESVGQDKLGRQLTDAEIAEITESVHAAERNDWSAQMVGGVMRMPPDLSALIDAYIEEELAEEQDMQAGGEYFEALMQMIQGGGFSMGGGS